MEVVLNSQCIVGIACCGIYHANKNIKDYITKAEAFIKGSGETELAVVDLIINRKFILNSICYSIQIAPLSSKNEYAVISGNSYSVFKVMEERKNKIRLLWNGEPYDIIRDQNGNFCRLTINNTNVFQIETTDNPKLQSSFISFTMFPSPPINEKKSYFDQSLSELNNILNGYSLPEPFFSESINIQLERIFTILRDPLLPSWQFQNYLDSNSSSLPSGLLSDLQQLIGHYTSNFSSLFSRFPSNKIKLLIENYITFVNNNNNTQRDLTVLLRPALELAEMFSSGIRGNARNVTEKLLLDYLRVEIKFQDEETLLNSISFNKEITISDVLSHNRVYDKNKLILSLLEFLEKYLPGVILDLRGTIHKLLAGLPGSAYSSVVSKLREVLIVAQIPSYDVRKNEMEAIFLNSINGNNNGSQIGRLENLIYSNLEVFDIISDFFYHKIVEIRKCALEVYVRRAYIGYEIASYEHSQLSAGQLCLLFKFKMPSNRNNDKSFNLKRSNSYFGIENNKVTSTMMALPIYHKQVSSGFNEREDMSDEELSLEEYYRGTDRRSVDYDTDSAVSFDAGSLSELSVTISEHVDSDSVLEFHLSKSRQSPSARSLDTFRLQSNYSSFKDCSHININTSDTTLDKSITYKCNRSVSMFCNNQALVPVQNLSSQYDFGVMIIFDTLDEIERNLQAIKELLSIRNSEMDDMDYLKYDMTTLNRDSSPIFKVILKMILRDLEVTNKSDAEVASILTDFCRKHERFFEDICVIEITFLLQSLDKTIRYFTLRMRMHFEEDIKLRNIDPVLSFQLEINRLRDYHLERITVPNGRMYVYMCTREENAVIQFAECRLFTRSIIYHKDFPLSTSSIDVMAKEAERNLLESMDAFDMAWVDSRAVSTRSNHIFFYFHSVLCINKIEELENVVRSIIFKHGRRLWSLRITQAELKITVKVNNGTAVPIRLWVHNEGGKSLDVCIYREEYLFKTGNKVLVSWSNNRDGRYHGVPVDFLYSL